MTNLSTCLLTMPRSGSEIIMSYFSRLNNLESGGEFLHIHPSKLTQVDLNENELSFIDRFKIKPIELKFSDKKEVEKWMVVEWNKRLQIIENYESSTRPLIIKSFVDAYQFNPVISLSNVSSKFNIIVLSRDSWKTLLSGFICQHLGVWHLDNEKLVNDIKIKLVDVKFEIDENYFFHRVQTNNFLKIVQNNIKNFNPNAISLRYEDFGDDPINKLNGIFNAEVSANTISQVHSFIENHEDHIQNIDKIKKIYDMYSI